MSRRPARAFGARAGAFGGATPGASRRVVRRGIPKLAPPGVAAAGFTLIELLVTIAIVAILVGAVVLNIEFRNVGKAVRNVALRTGLIMNLAADQAVYARQQFGIRFHPNSYEFWVLAPAEEATEEDPDPEPEWTPFDDGRLNYEAPAGIAIAFEVEISGVPIILEELFEELSDATDEDPLKPHVLFLSNGEIMPDFRILISDTEGEFLHEVRSGEVDPIVVEQLEGSSP